MEKVARKQDSFDAPISDPDNDLLGMHSYASTLARFLKGDEPPYITPPFTVGIYGQWGEGKTSFVHLLHHFLDPQARTGKPTYKFIQFESWPYSDSDVLWRALILTIAKELYKVPPQHSIHNTSNTTPRGLMARLAALLRSDGLTLRPEPAKVDEYADYHALEQRLNRGGYGKVGRDGSQPGQLEETSMLAVIGGALNAIGSISPLVAAVRGFFNLDTSLNLMEAVNQEKNEAIRETIKSIEEFRAIFNDLIRDKGGNKPVFVFIDDLDRCRPEVVLDVLEAIKIFLGEANCIFIVAADEQLIGQGLRLRYKDLLELGQQQTKQGEPVPQILQPQQSYFAEKGQEYFEKIIQLGVRVPPRDMKHAHSFVSAQFPSWAPATDITRIALSTNPRRLKQHCNYLAYLRLVYEMRVQSNHNKNLIGIFHKLVAFRARSMQHFNAFCALAYESASYCDIVKAMETLLLASEDDVLHPEAQHVLSKPEHYELYTHIVHIAPLLRLFKTKPSFTSADAADIKILALFADVEPDSLGNLQTEDGPFKRVLDAVINPTFESQPSLDLLQDLVKSGLAQLICIDLLKPEVMDALVQLARDPAWRQQIRLVDQEIDMLGHGGRPALTGLGPAARQLIAIIEQNHLINGQLSELFEILITLPRLSMILPEEVEQYQRIRHSLPSPDVLLNSRFVETPMQNKALRVAEVAYQNLTENIPAHAEVEKLLLVRLQIAQHCWEVRKFGKLYALGQRWTQLADQLRENPSVLYSLESRFLQPQALDSSPDTTDDLEHLWQYWQQDKKLGQFLRLWPPFSQFVQQTPALQEFFAISPDLVKSPMLTDFLPIASQGQADRSKPPATVTQVSTAPYVDLNVTIEEIEEPSPASGEQQPTLPETYTTRYKLIIDFMEQIPSSPKVEDNISIDWVSFLEDIRIHLPFPRNRSGGRPSSAQRASSDTERATTLNAEYALAANTIDTISYIGTKLYTTIFQNETTERAFAKMLRQHPRTRIILKFPKNHPQFAILPWECLYMPSAQVFLGLIERYSILRLYEEAIQERKAQFRLPLKLLAVLSEPLDAPPIHAEAHARLLESIFAEVIKTGQVEIRIVKSPTFEKFRAELASFKPDVFHFYGHGIFDHDRNEGALLFTDEEGQHDIVFASKLRYCFANSTVQFAVLHACDSATTATTDFITGIAGALINAGVTATVATMSIVLVDAAMCFSRDFYQVFLAGKSIEEAVIHGRNAVQAIGLDWSPYALFTNSTNLDGLRLMMRRRS